MTWGARSKGRAKTTHPDVQKVAARVDRRWSSTVLEGRRNMERQRKNVAVGVSQTLESKHLLDYSEDPDNGVDAIDVAPDPLRWPNLKKRLLHIDELVEALTRDGLNKDDRQELSKKVRMEMAAYAKELGRWYMFGGYMLGVADEMYEQKEIGRRLRWGGDWDGDRKLTDQSFDDLPHFEVIP